VYLVHDILDKQVVDDAQTRMGRVDGLVLTGRAGEPPHVAFIEMGATTLANRLPRWLGGIIARLARRFGARHGEPYRIPWERVTRIGKIEIELSIDAERTTAYATERWLRDHVIGRIPGSGKPTRSRD
jgi:sporulation protein YlmC with PRC-barrel domain